MQSASQRDPIPAFARDVLTLFREQLADVQFPSVNQASLEAAARALESVQAEVEHLEQEVAEARARVAARADELTALAQRALAYARVYSETDEALSARVERVAQHQTSSASAGAKKRGRPRKISEPEEGLFQQVTESPEMEPSLLDS